MSRVLVAGLGNEWRRDDGVGPAVALRVARMAVPGVRVIVNVGEPADLVDAWRGAEVAVVVDAMHGALEPGAHLRIDAADGELSGLPVGVSGHSYALPNVVELARALDAMPGRLLIFAVQGEAFDSGQGLTPAVAAAVERVAAEILDEIAAAVAP
ncbi:MAG: hydrogenase maturation protease [Deinococcales bacterium]